MKRGAFVVVLLYGIILVCLTVPVLLAAFHPLSENFDMEQGMRGMARQIYTSRLYWGAIVCMLISQWALLIVPVKVESRRPVTKKAVFLPVITAGFLLALLVAGFALAVAEAVFKDGINDLMLWIIMGLFAISWFWWAAVFSVMSRKKQPQDLISRIVRFLFIGSILELFVAVPTHILARYRHYCCAGFYTFIGLTFGLAIMLMSFGPAVFVLFINRWKKVRPAATDV